MKGELLSFEDIKKLKDNSRVWVIWTEDSSDIYTIKKFDCGIDFIKNYSTDDWLSFFMTYTALEYSMNNNIARVYRWSSNREYLENGLSIVKSAIDSSLDMKNRKRFMKLSREYRLLLDEIELVNN